MAAGVYSVSVEESPVLFTIRLNDPTNSYKLIVSADYVIHFNNGTTLSGTTNNAEIAISWFNVNKVELLAGDCWENQDISIDVASYLIQYLDYAIQISGCVLDQQLNRGSYFTWFAYTGVDINDLDVEKCSKLINDCFGFDSSRTDVINPYIKDCVVNHFPIITPYQETTFYLNLSTPIDSSVSNVFELGVLDKSNNLIIASIGTLQKHIVNVDNDYVYYATNIKPQRDDLVDCERYRFIIYDKSTDEALYVSVPWLFRTTKVEDDSTYLEYRNNSRTYNFDYPGLPNFLNKVRLKMYRVAVGSDTELDTYRSETTGTVRIFESTLDKFIRVECYWFDDFAIEASMILTQHDEIYLNGTRYTVRTPFQPEDEVLNKLQKGTFELTELSFSQINRFCP